MASLARCRLLFFQPSFISANYNSCKHAVGFKSRNSCGRRNVSTVGFVGLGNMGSRMAKNLIDKGHALSVYDVSPESMTRLESLGARVCLNPSDVVKQSDILVSMLPNNATVLEAYQGANGILESVKAGTLLIDSSTIDPSIAVKIATAAEKEGAVFLDAPVSGGVIAAEAGTLTFMVGGRESEFPAAKEMLQLMGSRITYCGPVGSGQAAKICNNMLLGISMIGTAEAMNLGLRLGLDKKLLAEIINSSSGRCWSSDLYNPVPGTLDNANLPSNNEYKGGFGTQLMTKDLGLAQDAATRTLTPTPLGSLAHQMYRMMVNNGYADKDFSSVYQFFQDDNVKV